MATFDLQEQDQLDDLKLWWARYGALIAGVLVTLCVAVIGWQAWRWYQGGHLEAGATLYNAVSEGVRTNDAAKSKDAMAQLTERYGSTPYAPRAALLYARQLWDAGDKAGARAQLNYVMEHGNDPRLTQVARYRLAEIELDAGKPDLALGLLDAKTDDAFTGVYADLRGDALAAAGRPDDARTAYQTALAKLDERSPYRTYVEVKYQALGGTTTPAGAPSASANGKAAVAGAASVPAAAGAGSAAPAAAAPTVPAAANAAPPATTPAPTATTPAATPDPAAKP